jgi:hypothetical protein
MEQILDRGTAEREPVALAKTRQTPCDCRCRFDFGRLLGQTVSEHVERLIQRFVRRVRQYRIDRLSEGLFLLGP